MISVKTQGIEAFSRLSSRFADNANKAASLAINDIARLERTLAKRQMQAEVNVPPATFEGKNFAVTKFANPRDLEAVISAARRPLNLSRFITSRTPKLGAGGRKGIEVQVKKGGAKRVIPGSFLIPGPSGGFGLALRSKTPLRASRAARQIRPGLYILSGPSVNQMFGIIAPRRERPAADALERQFLRQFERLQRG